MEFSVTRIKALSPHQDQLHLKSSNYQWLTEYRPTLQCSNIAHFQIWTRGSTRHSQALSKALIPYYPLAGRLHVSDQNELQIACSADGVWFVEALADCTLDAVNYFDDAMSIPYEKLLPVPTQENDSPDPLLQMQVTQFGCKGFVIGLIFYHSICDGLGAAQFLHALGEIARGSEKPSITPEWCWNFLQSPRVEAANPSGPPPIPIPDYQLEPVTIDLPLEEIKELKQKFRKWSGRTCSTFEMVAAMLWRQRTLAISLKDETQVKLVFFANCHQILDMLDH